MHSLPPVQYPAALQIQWRERERVDTLRSSTDVNQVRVEVPLPRPCQDDRNYSENLRRGSEIQNFMRHAQERGHAYIGPVNATAERTSFRPH